MKEKLQQLLAPLAKKLPFLQKFVGEPAETDEETGVHEVSEDTSAEAPQSLVDKIKAKIPFLNKKVPVAQESEADEAGNSDKTDPSMVLPVEEDSGNKSLLNKVTGLFKLPGKGGGDSSGEPSKKKLKPVHIIVIVLILGVVLFGDEEKPKVEETPKVTAQPKKPKKIEAPVETEPVEEIAPETAVVEEKVETPTVATEAPPASGEKKDVAGTEIAPPSTSPIDTPGAVEGLDDLTSGIKLDEDDGTTANSDVQKDNESLSTNANEGTAAKVSQEGLKELETKVADKKKKKNNAPQLDYVTPPDYEIQGRGLVYSCKGKHWACVTGAGFGQCEKNYSYNTNIKDKVECYPDNVYMTDEDCARAQLEKINESVDTTEYCKI